MADRRWLRRLKARALRAFGVGARLARTLRRRSRRELNRAASTVRLRDLPPRPQGWNAVLHTVRWLDENRLELSGWAHDWNVDYSDQVVATTMVLISPVTNRRVVAQLTMTPTQEPNLPRRETPSSYDYSPTQFRAVLDARQLIATGAPSWVVRLVVEHGSDRASGAFTRAISGGSAGLLSSKVFGNRLVRPAWNAEEGLQLFVEALRPAVVSCETEGRRLTIRLAGGQGIREAALVGPQGRIRLKLTRKGSMASGEIPELNAGLPWASKDLQQWLDTTELAREGGVPVVRHRLVLRTTAGEVNAAVQGELPARDPGASLVAEVGQSGEFWLVDTKAQLIVDGVQVAEGTEPTLRVRARLFGDPGPMTLALIGPNERITASVTVAADGAVTAEFPLLVSRWEQPLAAWMSGRYVLAAFTGDGIPFTAYCARSAIDQARESILTDWYRLRLELLSGRRLAVRLSRPLADDELGPVNQARLEQLYRSGVHAPRDAVFLECFRGRQVSCNPLALDEQLRVERPELSRFWSVVDRSLPVPPGARQVVEGSKAWWAARGASRWVITNDWLRARFHHQPHQVVLQTWHGTMFKRIGLDLPTMTADKAPDYVAECGKWDLLLSQNPHSSRVFESAYAWDRELIEDGYPRNDILRSDAADRCRKILGISEDVTVIMYAPTWRDDRTDVVTHLDVTELARQLGDGYVVLMRGHWRPIRFGSGPQLGRGAIDVSTYPNIGELFLVADAVVTDYSSLMFDYSITGRPMIFYVPDLDDYCDVVRGVYFDLAESAPGPVVETFDGVVAAIRSIERDRDRYAAKYAAWQERFNPWDDGHASERVLAKLFATSPSGVLDRGGAASELLGQPFELAGEREVLAEEAG